MTNNCSCQFMKNVILYIAVSLDGYIADSNGSVDWIKGQNEDMEMEDTFASFFQEVDTVFMGRKTYDQIVTQLSPNEWPYYGAITYVLTHNDDSADTECIRFRNTDICKFVEDLKSTDGKNIWICGGADIAKQLIEKDVIDIYHLAIVPVILGRGIRLFDTDAPQINLALFETKEYNWIIELIYEHRQPHRISV